jgi:hypothetical protein
MVKHKVKHLMHYRQESWMRDTLGGRQIGVKPHLWEKKLLGDG